MTDYILGVTGNIASGKSTVTAMLAERGTIVIDSDLVYRELVTPGKPLLAAIADRFGSDVIAADGSLDRAALGAIVFSDPAALATLDQITHPAVIAEVNRRMALVEHGVVVLDAVKLFESGSADRCDAVWLVVADPEIQVRRLMIRNRLTSMDARRRVAAQTPLETKLQRANLVIDNSGSLDELRKQVDRAWRDLPFHSSSGPGTNRRDSGF